MLIAVKKGKIFKNTIGVYRDIDMYYEHQYDEIIRQLETLRKFSMQDGTSFIVNYEEDIRGNFHDKFGEYFDLIVE